MGWTYADGFGVAPLPVTARTHMRPGGVLGEVWRNSQLHRVALPLLQGWWQGGSIREQVPEMRKGRFALFTAPPELQIRCPTSQAWEARRPQAVVRRRCLARTFSRLARARRHGRGEAR